MAEGIVFRKGQMRLYEGSRMYLFLFPKSFGFWSYDPELSGNKDQSCTFEAYKT